MILKRKEKGNVVKALYDSSNVLASTYDTNNGDLTVIFKSGLCYKYAGVSKTDYMRLETADSQGTVFNTYIKKYTFEKLEAVDPAIIIAEATNLKADEDKALIDGKRTELKRALNIAVSSEAVLLSYGKTKEETEKMFYKDLENLKTIIIDFLNLVNKDN